MTVLWAGKEKEWEGQTRLKLFTHAAGFAVKMPVGPITVALAMEG